MRACYEPGVIMPVVWLILRLSWGRLSYKCNKNVAQKYY